MGLINSSLILSHIVNETTLNFVKTKPQVY